MEGVSLKSRAIVFSICAGAVAFILALLATADGTIGSGNLSRALIPAIVCAVLCWACTERALSQTAAAIDSAIDRLTDATHGDLSGGIAPEITVNLPALAGAMEQLFAQMNANLATVHQMAMFDPVTALPNRTNFSLSVEGLLAATVTERHGALFFIDLDRFKAINDTLGHANGDLLLAMVADRLRKAADGIARDDAALLPVIGRLAGDEFTMFCPGAGTEGDALEIGRRLLFVLSAPFDLEGSDVAINASIGIALHPAHGDSLVDLMRAADAAMYRAKAAGRGRVEQYSAALAAEIADRAQLESDLRAAIDAKQFTLGPVDIVG